MAKMRCKIKVYNVVYEVNFTLHIKKQDKKIYSGGEFYAYLRLIRHVLSSPSGSKFRQF